MFRVKCFESLKRLILQHRYEIKSSVNVAKAEKNQTIFIRSNPK
nr:MAG TPA: hypothetical protein [Caudoviricetes sp.]